MENQTDKKTRYEKAEAAYVEFAEKLFGYAFGITGDAAEARDIVAEAYARLLEEPKLASPDFMVRPWLYRVATNLSRNFITRFLRRILAFPNDLLDAMHASKKSGVPERIIHDEALEELARSMRKLDHLDREIIFLRYYEHLGYAEISEVTGVPEGTVASRLSRATRRLANEFENN